jgi:hypothetical protein
MYRRLGGPQNRSGRLGEEKVLNTREARTPTTRSSRSQSLYRLRYPGSRFSREPQKISPCFPGVATVSGLRSLFHCCIPGTAIISSRPSVRYDRVPYAVRERRDESSVCGRRQTSAGAHHRPGSVSSAVGGVLRLDAHPHIGPPLQPLL